jgi:hypothetical protein
MRTKAPVDYARRMVEEENEYQQDDTLREDMP